MKPEYLGARASNTGDDFHEWWALRSTLTLIAPNTKLKAITVEGIHLENKKKQGLREWDSVDCALYYGGYTVEKATKVVIEQLKYSAATPNKLWTVSDLITAKSKKLQNSVIKGLANSFVAIQKIRPDLIERHSIKICLVSNRRLGNDLVKSLKNTNNIKYEKLRKASGLNKSNFKKFIRSLDFSNCGAGSRFEQEEKAIKEILILTQDANKGFVLTLKDCIHKMMMPEETGSHITKEKLLAWMNVSDPSALFPCPSMLQPIDNYVDRNAAKEIHNAMIEGSQFICLHGEGGSGKTTVLSQVEKLLPDSSTMIIYDCYGSGTYMDSDAYRHRPEDAYLQIINELSARLRLPLLISQNSSINFLKTFKQRLESASCVLKSQSNTALLVIVIDAADNSITGAEQCKPKEISFIHELLKIGELPSNVRLMISARTGRLPSLTTATERFLQINISNFHLEETALNARAHFPDATDTWIEDFHHLSNNNPRVQSYAFDYAESNPSKAIDYLRPNGKGLDQIFEGYFKEAIKKNGGNDQLDLVCSGLIALPSPVPKEHLANIIGISRELLNDIVADLPGIRFLGDAIGFLDEDVEFFVRKKAQTRLQEVQDQAASYFYSNHQSDEYSAMHLAGALFSSGQGNKIIEIIENIKDPVAIKDQIIRREIQRQRLKLAMKFCCSSGKPADAIFTLLVGAEAIKTDEAVNKIIIENPDLSVHFAQDAVGRNILYSSTMYKDHGKFLAHIIARDANNKDFIAVREKTRLFDEWMKRRREYIEEEENNENHHIDQWRIDVDDIAAIAHSILDEQGIKATYNYICSWKSKQIHFEIALNLIDRLLNSGEVEIIQRFLENGCVPDPWSSLLSIPLACAGYQINFNKLEAAICHKRIVKYFDLNALNSPMSDGNTSAKYIELVLTGVEILAASGKELLRLKPVLESLYLEKWRLIDNIHVHNSLKNDITFRAFSLLERYKGNKTTIESFWIEPRTNEDLDEQEKQKFERKLNDKRQELKENLSSVFNVYTVRADILLNNIPLAEIEKTLTASLSPFLSNAWRLSRDHYLKAISNRLSLAIGKLAVIPGIDVTVVLTLVKKSFKRWPDLFSAGQRIALTFLLKIPALRNSLIDDIYKLSNDIVAVKTAASEKIDLLLDLSRILIFIDKDEAHEIFKMATSIANDVDVDAMHEVSLFYSLARNSNKHFSQDDSIHIASRMISVTCEYGTLLEGYEHFPWDDAIRAVAILDMPKAISMIGYLEDCNLSSANNTIPPLISIGITTDSMSVTQAVSLLNFCNDIDDELLTVLASSKGIKNVSQFVEEISRSELLRFNKVGRPKIGQILNNLIPYNVNNKFWHEELNKLILFRKKNDPNNRSIKDSNTHNYAEIETKKEEFLSSISFPDELLESDQKFIVFLRAQYNLARENKVYISRDDIITYVAKSLPSNNRISFLNLIINETVIDDIGYSWAKTLICCIDLLSEYSHAVVSWKKTHLPKLIAEYLNEFTYGLSYNYEKDMLSKVLSDLELENNEIVDLLLDGFERNSNSMPLDKLYKTLGVLADYCTGIDVADVTVRYLDRLTSRLKLTDKLTENVVDTDSTVAIAIAHQFYSLLGDVDVRTRWRAAHSIRTLARLGDLQTIVTLTELYDCKEMPGYREEKAPFYWLAARLWLVITFDRIATEIPKAIIPIANWLLEIATDQNFPHVLIRHFAKSCLTKLITGGYINFDINKINAVEAINNSLLDEKKAVHQFRRGGFHQSEKNRRFQFDVLDTLGYVYPSAIECFSDVEEDEFLNEAEKWIIDRWKINEDLSPWENEPRKNMFQNANYSLYSCSHGAMPTLEKYRYYLEWHAMWCSVGSLMVKRPFAKPEYHDDDYGAFNLFLQQNSLTQSPHWPSDLRCPIPLEQRFHYPPIIGTKNWVKCITAHDFDLELGLASNDNMLAVDSYHCIRTKDHCTNIRISSAMVSPNTAQSLVRALQTSNDSHDYRLPPSNHHFEIDNGEYQLYGWLDEYDGDSRIDEKDTFNHGIRKIESSPSNKVIKALELYRTESYPVTWINKNDKEQSFVYQAWTEKEDDLNKEKSIYDNEVISDGHRLKVTSKSLKNYLNITNFDLIVEVEIIRRGAEYGITKYDQESEKEARYARIYLLRRTGEILTTEGCVGTWMPSDE